MLSTIRRSPTDAFMVYGLSNQEDFARRSALDDVPRDHETPPTSCLFLELMRINRALGHKWGGLPCEGES